MKHMLSFLTVASATYAAVIPRQATPCTFVMVGVGSPNGTITEDTIGENRIGGGYPQGTYSINAKVLTDSYGHNCSISASTAQFQCSSGSAVTLFTLGDNYDLLYDDTNPNWLACPADGPGEDGSYNIFTQAKTNTTGCETVNLLTGGFSCAALGRPSSTSASAVASSTSTATASSIASATASCPKNIDSGSFEYPHLIVPTSSEDADHAFGNSYTAHITSSNSTLFNFDVPSTYTGTCALVFLFPFASNTQAGVYTFTGIEEEEGEKGGLDFALLSGIANTSTTYNTTPSVTKDYGTVEIVPGNNYTVATFPCPAGQTVTYSGSSVAGVGLEYFENSAPSAIGLYMVPCV